MCISARFLMLLAACGWVENGAFLFILLARQLKRVNAPEKI